MPKKREVLPQPRSRFVEVKCPKCGNVQIVYDHATKVVRCRICEEQLTRPSGGKARIIGEVVRVLS